MFLAFTYASHEGLGWDNTMTLRWDGDTPQYDITVQPFPAQEAEDGPTEELKPRTFRTEELLSGIGAEHLRGRGTRVWAVKELIDGRVGKDTFVLKDTWIDSDRIREGYITAKILRSVQNKNDKALVRSALLTTEIHGDVHVDGKADCTLAGDLRSQLLNKHKPRFNFRQDTPKKDATPPKSKLAETLSDATSGSAKATTLSGKASIRPIGDHRDAVRTEKALQLIFFHSKTHYRIVFVELCKPLYKTTSLQDILWMLVQATAGMLTVL